MQAQALARRIPNSSRGDANFLALDRVLEVAPVDLGRSPNLLVLGFAESFIEGIACPAHADDRITFATGRQCFAKASYVDIDRPVGDVDGW
jgi:hypothetical protein